MDKNKIQNNHTKQKPSEKQIPILSILILLPAIVLTVLSIVKAFSTTSHQFANLDIAGSVLSIIVFAILYAVSFITIFLLGEGKYILSIIPLLFTFSGEFFLAASYPYGAIAIVIYDILVLSYIFTLIYIGRNKKLINNKQGK